MTPLFRTLTEAVDGLTYPSEQDNPIKAFLWRKTDAEPASPEDEIRKAGEGGPGCARGDAVRGRLPRADRHAAVVARRHGEQVVQRGQQLAAKLRETLTDLQVFRVGDTDKKVYLVGKTADGDLAGVSTEVVET